MKTEKAVKVIGLVASVVGVAASLATSWATDKKTEATIAEKVEEAIKKSKVGES